jgi:hypothetical protein
LKEYQAFIALVGIAGVIISALLLAPAQSEDIFIISNGGSGNDTTDCTNLGAGTQVYKDGNCNFRTLVGSSDISIINGSNTIVIDYNGTVSGTDCINVGAGTHIIQNSTDNCYVRTLVSGTGISLSNNSNTVTITNSSPDNTSCTNVGTGSQVYKENECDFRTILGSADISVTQQSNTITIDYNGTAPVTSVGATSPIISSGGTTPTISCPTCATSGMTLLVDKVLNSSGTVNIVTGTAASITCANTGISACAELADTSSALIGKKVNSLSMYLLKSNSPTGTNTVCVMDSSANCIYIFGTIDSATITGSAAQYLFYNITHTHTITLGNYIGMKTNIQTGSNAINVRGVISASNYDTTASLCAQYISGSWTSGVNCDLGATAQPFILAAVNSFSFSAYDNYMISLQTANTGASTLTIMLNGDTNAVYSTRYSINGGADGTSTNQRACQPTFTTGQNTLDNLMLTMYIGDITSSVKRGIMGETAYGFDSALSTAPSRTEFVCKFNNQSNPITSIQISATGLPPFDTNIVNTGTPSFNGHIEIWGYN